MNKKQTAHISAEENHHPQQACQHYEHLGWVAPHTSRQRWQFPFRGYSNYYPVTVNCVWGQERWKSQSVPFENKIYICYYYVQANSHLMSVVGKVLRSVDISAHLCPRNTDYTTAKWTINLHPRVLWYQVHLWTPVCSNMVFVVSKQWLSQKYNNKALLGIRSGRPSIPIQMNAVRYNNQKANV